MFGLYRSKLHRNLVDGTVKSVWFRQVFGLLRGRIRQVTLYVKGIKPFISGLTFVRGSNQPSAIAFLSSLRADIQTYEF